MNHCFKSANYVNVVVADKQLHLQYLNMDDAINHCTKGLGVWHWASNDAGEEPDVVMASCGDVSTQEALAATALLRQYLPQLKIRFVNVVDLFKLIPNGYHPHGLTNNEYSAIFTDDKPVVFNFHSYPWLVHRLTYNRPNQIHMHVRGYKEKGNIDSPLELAIRNEADRYSLAVLAIDNLKDRLGNTGADTRERLLDEKIKSLNYTYGKSSTISLISAFPLMLTMQKLGWTWTSTRTGDGRFEEYRTCWQVLPSMVVSLSNFVASQ